MRTRYHVYKEFFDRRAQARTHVDHFGKFPMDITPIDTYRANEAAKFYLGSLENMDENHLQEVNNMITDSFVQYGTHKFVEIHTMCSCIPWSTAQLTTATLG